jgi:uncharacterized protein (TIGR03083 family)
MTEPHARAYTEVRTRVIAIVSAADAAVLDAPSPATPEWRSRDVLAHLVGVSDDVVKGRLDGLASDEWTAAQVDARRDTPVAELLVEWDKHYPQFEQMLAAAPAEITGQAVFDAFTHEQDLRHALGVPGARDCDAMLIGWEWITELRSRIDSPALRYITEAGEVVAGTSEPVATIEASRFELLRASTGRRSASEVAHYGWDRAPDAELLLVASFFRVRDTPLDE